MKLVINYGYGGFQCNEEMEKVLGKQFCNDVEFCGPYSNALRANEQLVALVENGKGTGDLIVVEIPDESTDYIITQYDGSETVYYVLDGKIKMVVNDFYLDDFND